MKTAPEFLHKAAALLEDRGKDYDQPQGERSMGKTVRAFNTVTGKDLTEAEGWLLLQILKDVRQWQKPEYHADSAEDCVSYAALKAEALANVMPTDFGQQHMIASHVALVDVAPDPSCKVITPMDEERADRIANSHGDGEHYAELEAKKKRWEGAPSAAMWRCGDREGEFWFTQEPEWREEQDRWIYDGYLDCINEVPSNRYCEARPC